MFAAIRLASFAREQFTISSVATKTPLESDHAAAILL
jgi:hypothetical protein